MNDKWTKSERKKEKWYLRIRNLHILREVFLSKLTEEIFYPLEIFSRFIHWSWNENKEKKKKNRWTVHRILQTNWSRNQATIGVDSETRPCSTEGRLNNWSGPCESGSDWYFPKTKSTWSHGNRNRNATDHFEFSFSTKRFDNRDMQSRNQSMRKVHFQREIEHWWWTKLSVVVAAAAAAHYHFHH